METRLKSLEIEGFRSFQRRTRFDFPQGDNVVMVDGKWKNSPIRSGSGKTTIMQAWAFLFDICSISMANLKNWHAKKLFVQGTVQIGPDEVVITRDPKLTLTINGKPYEGLQLGAKEKLAEMLGVSPDMLKAMTWRKQRTPGKLVHSTDSEIKEFLSQPLGLGKIEVAAEQFTKSSNKAMADLELIKRDIANYEMNLGMNIVTEAELTQAQAHIDQAKANVPIVQLNVTTAEQSLAALENEKLIAQQKANDANVEYQRLAADNKAQTIAAEIRTISAEIAKINQINSNIQVKREANATLKKNIVQLQADLENLKVGTCPTCSREWDQTAALKASKEAQYDRALFDLQANVEYIKNSEPMLTELPAMNARLAQLNQEHGQANGPIEMARQNAGNANTAVQMVSRSIMVANNEIANAKNAVNAAMQNVIHAERALQQLQQKAQNYQVIVDKFTASKEALRKQEYNAEIEMWSAKLLGKTGFMGSIFDEILADIEARANDMLRDFPNANMFTIQINSSKLVKSKGTSKKEISVNVSRNGIDIEMDDISGGQQAAVELCTDLAAAEAIRTRSGCAIRWTFLDEVLDGLGVSEKEAVITMIRKRIKGLVLVIEHSSEVRESFDQTIQIEYDGKESYVIPS